MTKIEFEAANALYIKLLKKGEENRSEEEEAKYLYLDKLLTYIHLRAEAKRMGNKNPDENFLIKDAKERMESAQRNMREKIGLTKGDTDGR